MRLRQFTILILLMIYASAIAAHARHDASNKQGNFALPTAQQPGPLVSFGGNILDKGEAQLALASDFYVGPHRHDSDLTPSFLYAFSNKFSAYAVVPYAPSNRNGVHRSHGLEDSYLQFEYAFYERQNLKRALQATWVAYIGFPSGSANKTPATGNGAVSYFWGATYTYMSSAHLLFACQGFSVPMSKDGTESGWSYYYQFGINKVFGFEANRWIFAGLLECDGEYTARSVYRSQRVHDSGGNTITLTPSLWGSTKHLTLQLGLGVPIAQHLLGVQHRIRYFWISNIAWTFT